jgi:hypothetical protein
LAAQWCARALGHYRQPHAPGYQQPQLSSDHGLFLAAFINNIAELEFSAHTGGDTD